jgi:predicted phage terminase large subunit-like protein
VNAVSAQAAREMMRRRMGRESLAGFSRAIEVPGKPASEDPDEELFLPIETAVTAHHRLLLEAFERAASKRHGRLMVFMPPGSAKSTYCSVVAPVALMGRKPGTKIILASYGQDLARRHGRRARQVARQAAFATLWGGVNGNPARVELSASTSAADEWALTNGSEYLACGILSGVTGNRANGIVIDDPIKGREQADSETVRNKTWEAYQDDLLTRLIPGGWVVLVTTRWHEDDVAGRILPKNYNGESGEIECRDGKVWEVLNLPAQCERLDDPLGRALDEYLWPEWFDAGHWDIFKREARTWAALFQQRPRPAEGGIFKAAWFQRYKVAPAEGMVVQSIDGAYKPKQVNDPSVISTWLVTRLGYYLLHVWRDRVDYPTLKRMARSLALAWKPHAILIEDKASGQSLVQELRGGEQIQREHGRDYEPPLPVIAIEPEGDKLTRANTVSGICEARLVYLPDAAEWLPDFEGELFAFPLSANDDQVDTLTQLLAWAHKHSARIEVASIGRLVSVGAFDESAPGERSHVDDSGGFGIVRSTTSMDGF